MAAVGTGADLHGVLLVHDSTTAEIAPEAEPHLAGPSQPLWWYSVSVLRSQQGMPIAEALCCETPDVGRVCPVRMEDSS